MRPLARTAGTFASRSARRRFGHSSVSRAMKQPGSTRRTARRTAPRKSSGNVSIAAASASLARATRSPVAVTVETTMSAVGQRAARAWTSGTAAITSPTDTA